ncbi:MAG: hypothetical protein AB4352_05070 [Hormoscilla sp.]
MTRKSTRGDRPFTVARSSLAGEGCPLTDIITYILLPHPTYFPNFSEVSGAIAGQTTRSSTTSVYPN